ncbi:unnamed protein product, partial [Larinioides sclopetarius]
ESQALPRKGVLLHCYCCHTATLLGVRILECLNTGSRVVPHKNEFDAKKEKKLKESLKWIGFSRAKL